MLENGKALMGGLTRFVAPEKSQCPNHDDPREQSGVGADVFD
jgi:hypothetical protein